MDVYFIVLYVSYLQLKKLQQIRIFKDLADCHFENQTFLVFRPWLTFDLSEINRVCVIDILMVFRAILWVVLKNTNREFRNF